MKWNLLPHAESDYIFAIIGEELGFLGCLVVVTLYGVLAYAGFRIARRSADRFVQLASVAITVWLIGQAAMNMGYVVGLLPVTGVTLPLISAGGTSLVLTCSSSGCSPASPAPSPRRSRRSAGRVRGRLGRRVPPGSRLRRRPRPPPPHGRGAGRRPPVLRGGRTVVHARPGAQRPVPPRGGPPAAPPPSAPGGAARGAPPRPRHPAARPPRPPRPAPRRGPRPGRRPADALARRQPPPGAPRRRPGGGR